MIVRSHSDPSEPEEAIVADEASEAFLSSFILPRFHIILALSPSMSLSLSPDLKFMLVVSRRLLLFVFAAAAAFAIKRAKAKMKNGGIIAITLLKGTQSRESEGAEHWPRQGDPAVQRIVHLQGVPSAPGLTYNSL